MDFNDFLNGEDEDIPKKDNKKSLKKMKMKDKEDKDVLPDMIEDDTIEDIDLTEVQEKRKNKIQSSQEIAKKKGITLPKNIVDVFKKGIVSKIETGINTFTPEDPLTDSEREALELDFSIILMSPELLEKLEKIPLWLGIIMLIITLIFMIVGRIFTALDKKKKEDEGITVIKQPAPKPKPKGKSTKRSKSVRKV